MENQMTLEQQKLYDQAVKYLDVVVLANPTINLLKSDTSFQAIFVEVVGIVNYLETTFDIANGHVTRYAQAYFSICNKQLTVNDNKDLYQDIVDLKDKVNYINTYLYNRINSSIDDLENSFKANVTSENETTNNEAPIENNNVQNNEQQHFNHYSQPISDEEVLRKSGYTVHDVADQLIRTQASILLNRNIAKGKVFIYKSKPKIICLLKWITFSLFIALMCLSIASYGILMSQNGILSYLPQNSTQTRPLSFVNPLPYMQILLVVVISLISWSIIRNMKNDNAKFFMSWGWLSFYLAFLLIIMLTTAEIRVILFNWNGFLTEIKTPAWGNVDSSGNFIATAQSVINMLENWKIIQYCIFGIFGALVVCIVTAVVFNPKRDIERIEQLLQQYASEIRNGEIDTSDLGNSPLGGISTRMI